LNPSSLSYQLAIGKGPNGSASALLDVTGNAKISGTINDTTMTTIGGSSNGNQNTVFGYTAFAAQLKLPSPSNPGKYNTAIGAGSLNLNTTGSNNTAVGWQALFSNITGSDNTVVGTSAFSSLLGSRNTCVGSNAMLGNALSTTTTTQCTAIGYQAGIYDYNGSNNTYLGAITGQTSSDSNTYARSTAIGYNAVINASNQIVLGTSTEKVSIPGNYLGIGTYTPNSGNSLDVNGSVSVSGILNLNSLTYNGSIIASAGGTYNLPLPIPLLYILVPSTVPNPAALTLVFPDPATYGGYIFTFRRGRFYSGVVTFNCAASYKFIQYNSVTASTSITFSGTQFSTQFTSDGNFWYQLFTQ